ncbi:type IV secretory system conjugative DNA transfer family protein [Nocardia terpenica]|uniref:type IV secretory system conjugative DNA transfer family protein n=1 Tax=Nocardia terpenica TaxID=455432 RepID=UPI001892E512|nr:TraM recognition domain-containing protein [Nocardia terpenica]MBF6064696.1 type IV secretory system conjugative DNA transfer family protein [Nocardia terpenica]MBF6107212.1 type IV secretory system conjugative DNA transfer family protein [Nocardia terpenica]MBF6114970.1 type IV secretory system conjugative DNA transfer family protein [Nocardia terpenica]MBF6122075.1 type IV secretory system conjugative DNA transfer family protein [Nocardia terpenica]MBF6154458.1 type IV secretory system co
MRVTRETRRVNRSGIGQEVAALLISCGVILIGLLVWIALTLGCWWAGLPATKNPPTALIKITVGTQSWPWQSTLILAAFVAVVASGATRLRCSRRRSGRLDYAARTMQPVCTLTGATQRDVADIARRLLVDAPDVAEKSPGIALGTPIAGGGPLYLTWEMPATFVSGTRTGKTMAWAIPAALSAPGAMLSTSNKPDLYAHTRYGREQLGRVWLCDLQGVTGHRRAEFWWNPLAHIDTLADARKLASFFISASREPGDRKDAYFDGAAMDLLSTYILAAACAGGDLVHAAEWLGRDQDETPVLILHRHNHHNAARLITEKQSLTSRQRDGVFDMARRFLGSLTDETYARVVLPPRRRRISVSGDEQVGIDIASEPESDAIHGLPEFDPWVFVDSCDSLYALSMEGPDSAAPIMTALVGQIVEAALDSARHRPDGRLRVPLVCVLDEAANCCKLGELPNYFTYAGGHGVILMVWLQVLEQGKQIWGEEGLYKMFAQSVECYGGGIGDTTYLRRWVELIGNHEVADTQINTGRGGTGYTRSWRSEPIAEIADLAALEKDRALVRIPGNKPVLVRKTFWGDTEFAPLIHRSLELYGGDHAA